MFGRKKAVSAEDRLIADSAVIRKTIHKISETAATDPKLKRIDLADLHPAFAKKIRQLVHNLEARGEYFFALEGYRSFERQNALYAQGRTAPGRKVTRARGGQSAHQFGVACDFCKDKNATKEGLQPDWQKEQYATLCEEAEKLGLESGYRWGWDAPHIQLPLKKNGITMSKLNGLHKREGRQAVWRFLSVFFR